jgi:hypothetical protein
MGVDNSPGALCPDIEYKINFAAGLEMRAGIIYDPMT